jgi:hypothetical protein
MELRCGAKLHGTVEDGAGTLEVKCDSRFCGHRSGVVVLHKFDLHTGEVIDTVQYKAPMRGGKGSST